MDDFEIERLRRSVAMLPEGLSSAGAMSRERAQGLLAEVIRARADAKRCRQAVAELRRVLEGLEPGWAPGC
jgi:hypothetical protein